jgi:hypothetical protein
VTETQRNTAQLNSNVTVTVTYLHIPHQLGQHFGVFTRLLETGHANLHVPHGLSWVDFFVLGMACGGNSQEACHERENGGSSVNHCV